MAAGKPKQDLLPLCDGPEESNVVAELQQQENASMTELSDAKLANEQFSERAAAEAENPDVLTEELSEAAQHQWMTEGAIHAALQKSKTEVHHCEHEAMIQRQVGTKAEQAGRDLARGLSEFQSEAKARSESEQAQDRADLSVQVPMSPSAFIARL